MAKPVIGILFMLAIFLTVYRGAVTAFVTLYLPALLLLFTTPRIDLPQLPDMSATYAVIYGILGGLVIKGGEPFPFRWGLMDTLMCLLTVSMIITAMATEKVWTGVNVFGEQFLGALMPYFLARIMFHSAEARRTALWMLVACALFIAFFALVEVRLIPFLLSRLFKGLGLFSGQNTMVLYRWGLFRTQALYCHPIDMGNSSLLVTALIALFAMTTSVGIKHPLVMLGLFAAFGSALTSLSFTSYMGIAAACALFAAIRMVPLTGRLLPLVVLLMFVGGAAATYKLKNTVVDRGEDEMGQTVEDSMLVRALIVQNSWPWATSSGLFGYGNTIRHSQLNLDSVDNSYMLFTMRRGFVFLILFLCVPVVIAWRGVKAFHKAPLTMQRLPLAVAVAGCLGIMVAMYTVWFGFVYSILWTILIGVTMSMMDVLIHGAPTAAAASNAAMAARNRAMYRPSQSVVLGGA